MLVLICTISLEKTVLGFLHEGLLHADHCAEGSFEALHSVWRV